MATGHKGTFKGNVLIQKLAWFYAANFLFIFIISHWPGLTDFSITTFGRNLPHIVIPVSMMAIGFVLARLKQARAKAG